MVSSMGIPAIGSERTDWRLLFATQPEPDLEFTEDDLDGAAPPPAPPMPEPKQSKKDRYCGSCCSCSWAASGTWPWIRTAPCSSSNHILRAERNPVRRSPNALPRRCRSRSPFRRLRPLQHRPPHRRRSLHPR